MGIVSCGIGGLVVAHVGRRLLFGRSPRQCAMPRHNGTPCCSRRICRNALCVDVWILNKLHPENNEDFWEKYVAIVQCVLKIIIFETLISVGMKRLETMWSHLGSTFTTLSLKFVYSGLWIIMYQCRHYSTKYESKNLSFHE